MRAKSGRSGALLGLNFPFFFTSLWPSEGSRRPNRAAVTPIRQENPPGPLKLLGLRKKTGTNTDFDSAQITLNILVYAFAPQGPRTISVF